MKTSQCTKLERAWRNLDSEAKSSPAPFVQQALHFVLIHKSAHNEENEEEGARWRFTLLYVENVVKVSVPNYWLFPLFVMAGLYTKGLIYIDVPIADDDYIVGKQSHWKLEKINSVMMENNFFYVKIRHTNCICVLPHLILLSYQGTKSSWMCCAYRYSVLDSVVYPWTVGGN